MKELNKGSRKRGSSWMAAGVVVLGALLLVSGCGLLGPGAVYQTADVSVSVGAGGPTTLNTPGGSRSIVEGVAAENIDSVFVTVSGEDKYGVFQPVLATAILTFNGSVWQGTIPDLPIGPALTFQASATDSLGFEIYTGSTTTVLGATVVGIVLYPVDDGVAISFPIIRSITRPAEIIHDQSATVSVGLEGSSSETLSLQLAGGDFTPSAVDVLLAANGTGTLDTTYTAPSVVGTYAHTVSATNSQGNSVTTGFSTVVVYDTGSAEITIGIAPAIVALSASRTGSDLTWSATVEDDGPSSELSFAWSFDGGLTFSDPSANPAILTGYSEAVTGTMTLTVTDGDTSINPAGLSTTVTFNLPAGMFPDDVVQEPSELAVPNGSLAVPSSAKIDIDVADDGTLAVVTADYNQAVRLSVYAPDGSPLLANYLIGTGGPSFQVVPVVVISDVSKKILVTWSDYGSTAGVYTGAIRYTMLDSDLSVLAANIDVWGPSQTYPEFHDAAMDDNGNAVIAYSSGQTHIAFVNPTGTFVRAPEIAFDINATYGTHIAINRATGVGLVAAQIHSGSGIYYRRFDSDRNWTDPGPVQIPVDYHAWYDGFTMGMNDLGDFAILWRSSVTEMKARFFAPDTTLTAEVSIPTSDFEDYVFDGFRTRHQQLELIGNDFVLGEVFNYQAPSALRVVRYYRYTPAGAQVAVNTTDVTIGQGLALRVDSSGKGYAFDSTQIAFFDGFLN